MTTPSTSTGIAASAGVMLGADVKVDLQVAPQTSGDVECELDCNGTKCKVIYRETGEIDFDTYPYQPQ
jgi:hypothetical protein